LSIPRAAKYALLLLALLLIRAGTTGFAAAQEGKTTAGASRITIISPTEGEILPAGKEVMMTYLLVKGLKDNGDHIHVYIDGANDGTSKRSPRSLGVLPPGKHTVLVKVANQEHDSVKVEATVQFEIANPNAPK
jgi:hypothetical protein